MIKIQIFFFAAVVVFFSGCATWSRHGVHVSTQGKYVLVLLPIQSHVKIKRLKDIQTIPKNYVMPENEKQAVQLKFEQIKREMQKKLEEKLVRTGKFEVLPQEKVQESLAEMNIASSNFKLDGAQRIELGKRLNAQVLMKVNLAGYGKVKKSWVAWMIATSIPEAASKGILIAETTANHWVAIGVAAEEVVQETLMWGGGAFVFNRFFTPVILNAKLYSTSDGCCIWRHTFVAMLHRKAMKKLPKPERKKKEVRLYHVSEKVMEDLTKKLAKKAGRNLRKDAMIEKSIRSGN